MSYIEGNAANIDALLTAIDTALMAVSGVTRMVVSALATDPGAGLLGRETLYFMPGTSSRPCSGGIGVYRSTSGIHKCVSVYSFSGAKLLATITNIVGIGGGAFQVTHNEAGVGGQNPFRSADHVVLCCSDNTLFNEGFTGSETAPTGAYNITRTANTTFTFLSAVSQLQTGAAGKCVAIQNLNGYRGVTASNGWTVELTDGVMAYRARMDEFGFGLDVEQGGVFQNLVARCQERKLAAAQSDVAKLSAAVAAASPATLPLDRNSPNIIPGQKVIIIHQGWEDSAHVLGGDTDTFEVVEVIAKTDDTHFTANTTKRWPANALVGTDPMPYHLSGHVNNVGASSIQFDNATQRHLVGPFTMEGGRIDPANPQFAVGVTIPNGANAADIAPDDLGNDAVIDIILYKTTSPSKGWRCFARPFWGFAHGVENNLDIGGAGLNASFDYKLFPACRLNPGAGFSLALGPGAAP